MREKKIAQEIKDKMHDCNIEDIMRGDARTPRLFHSVLPLSVAYAGPGLHRAWQQRAEVWP